jgi:hypothetical protein
MTETGAYCIFAAAHSSLTLVKDSLTSVNRSMKSIYKPEISVLILNVKQL